MFTRSQPLSLHVISTVPYRCVPLHIWAQLKLHWLDHLYPILHVPVLLPLFSRSHPQLSPTSHLNNHLRNTLSTKRLTTNETLTFNTSQRVERSRNRQKHSRSNQTRCAKNQAQPLNEPHDAIKPGSHVIRREAFHEGIEFGGGRADSEQKRNFDKDDEEGWCTVCGRSVLVLWL